MRDRRKGGGFWDTAKTVFYAVLIALVVRTFAYEPFRIPSRSMVPTLLVGDRLFVSKFTYGYSKHSLPFSIPLFDGRILADEPERGDVVVFKLPRDNRTDFIKRIIGLPGDEIHVDGGILHINDTPVTREFIEEFPLQRTDGNVIQARRYAETLPNGFRHDIIEIEDDSPVDNTPVFKVPEGHYFMMGDNRDDSVDSRFERVGYVPFENLVGRAEVIFFSSGGDGAFWEIWKLFGDTRYERLFQVVD